MGINEFINGAVTAFTALLVIAVVIYTFYLLVTILLSVVRGNSPRWMHVAFIMMMLVGALVLLQFYPKEVLSSINRGLVEAEPEMRQLQGTINGILQTSIDDVSNGGVTIDTNPTVAQPAPQTGGSAGGVDPATYITTVSPDGTAGGGAPANDGVVIDIVPTIQITPLPATALPTEPPPGMATANPNLPTWTPNAQMLMLTRVPATSAPTRTPDPAVVATVTPIALPTLDASQWNPQTPVPTPAR